MSLTLDESRIDQGRGPLVSGWHLVLGRYVDGEVTAFI